MTVRELIEKLQEMPPELKVVFDMEWTWGNVDSVHTEEIYRKETAVVLS